MIQTQTRRPRSFRRRSMAAGSGNVSGSHSKSHQWKPRIQKQSKWKTDSGRPRSAMPWMKWVTVSSS